VFGRFRIPVRPPDIVVTELTDLAASKPGPPYADVIMKVLPANARQIVEEQMIKGYQYQSDFARKYYGQGREEGRQEGLRGAVLTLARTKLGKLSDDDVAAIEAVSDLRVLTELIASLGQTSSTRKARAALARALAP